MVHQTTHLPWDDDVWKVLGSKKVGVIKDQVYITLLVNSLIDALLSFWGMVGISC